MTTTKLNTNITISKSIDRVLANKDRPDLGWVPANYAKAHKLSSKTNEEKKK